MSKTRILSSLVSPTSYRIALLGRSAILFCGAISGTKSTTFLRNFSFTAQLWKNRPVALSYILLNYIKTLH